MLRYLDFIKSKLRKKVPQGVYDRIGEFVLNLETMPSMRFLWAAGPALERSPTCGYNCTFLPVDSIESFSECLYCLMCGSGVGFSVEKKNVDKLPKVPTIKFSTIGSWEVPDTKEGWAQSIQVLMTSLFSGQNIRIDYSSLRPEGSRLHTMGGRSSGPAPLIIVHEFIREAFGLAQGRKFTTLECHDIMNQIADIVVSGGVRRSSQISLSDLDDQAMATAKVPPFPPRRFMSNNSAISLVKPGSREFLREWSILASSGTGERGIFNLEAARKNAPARRDSSLIEGTNPCVEINLRARQMCNLTEVVCRPNDDVDDLLDKVDIATWMGAIQSTFTDFSFLGPLWKKNCEEERLIGASLTGQMDCMAMVGDRSVLKALKRKALKTGRQASKALGINFAAAITCGKPSGTVSQRVDCSSGCHPRWSDFYLRRYRISSSDPLFLMMRDQGVRFRAEVGQRKKDWNKAERGISNQCSTYDGEKWTEAKVKTWVCEFPIKSPRDSVKRGDLTAIDQLNHYKLVQECWCEHNQSITVYVRDNEWFEVGDWVYRNWDTVNGVSFLPYDGGKYDLAPYKEITKERYRDAVKAFPNIDYSKLSEFENMDMGTGSREVACQGGSCDL